MKTMDEVKAHMAETVGPGQDDPMMWPLPHDLMRLDAKTIEVGRVAGCMDALRWVLDEAPALSEEGMPKCQQPGPWCCDYQRGLVTGIPSCHLGMVCPPDLPVPDPAPVAPEAGDDRTK